MPFDGIRISTRDITVATINDMIAIFDKPDSWCIKTTHIGDRTAPDSVCLVGALNLVTNGSAYGAPVWANPDRETWKIIDNAMSCVSQAKFGTLSYIGVNDSYFKDKSDAIAFLEETKQYVITGKLSKQPSIIFHPIKYFKFVLDILVK